MTARRAPILAALAVVVAGAVVASEASDGTPTARPVGGRPGVQVPALPPDDVLASTWYCAAGTASEDGMADHTVVVVNPGDTPVSGTLRVRTGELTEALAVDDALTAEDESAPPEDEADDSADDAAAGPSGPTGRDAPGEQVAASPRMVEGESAAAAAAAAPVQEPGVGDPWEEEGGVDETPIQETFELEPGGRTSVRLADLVEAPLAAALVEASAPVAVEHEVVGPDGRDAGPCASSAASEWHLAFGVTTRNAREVLALFNPFASTATVDVTFSTDDGVREPQRYQGLPIPAGGVVGLDVGEDVTRKGHVSTTVRARSGSLVVERLQSFDGSSGSRIRGLSVALATPEPLEAWGFATGVIGDGNREWIVLYNPGDERAEVDVSVRTAGESSPPPPYALTVRAGGYEVLEYGEDDRVQPRKGHVTIVRSSNGVPIVAERVLSIPGAPGWREPDSDATGGDISATTGAAFADREWVLATLGRRDDDGRDRLVAYNPDPEETATLDVRGIVDGRVVEPPERLDIEVPPGARVEVRLDGPLAAAGAAILAEADLPLVVERLAASSDRVVQTVSPGIIGGEGPLALADVDLGLTP